MEDAAFASGSTRSRCVEVPECEFRLTNEWNHAGKFFLLTLRYPTAFCGVLDSGCDWPTSVQSGSALVWGSEWSRQLSLLCTISSAVFSLSASALTPVSFPCSRMPCFLGWGRYIQFALLLVCALTTPAARCTANLSICRSIAGSTAAALLRVLDLLPKSASLLRRRLPRRVLRRIVPLEESRFASSPTPSVNPRGVESTGKPSLSWGSIHASPGTLCVL